MKTRWIVTHLNWERQKALAIKRGMPPADLDSGKTSLWDWIEPEEGEQQFGPYPNIQAAFEKAKKLQPLDSLAPRVVRQEYRPDQYDEDHYFWEDVCGWEIYADTDRINENDPDARWGD
jgi:hypothetical protein